MIKEIKHYMEAQTEWRGENWTALKPKEAPLEWFLRNSIQYPTYWPTSFLSTLPGSWAPPSAPSGMNFSGSLHPVLKPEHCPWMSGQCWCPSHYCQFWLGPAAELSCIPEYFYSLVYMSSMRWHFTWISSAIIHSSRFSLLWWHWLLTY